MIKKQETPSENHLDKAQSSINEKLSENSSDLSICVIEKTGVNSVQLKESLNNLEGSLNNLSTSQKNSTDALVEAIGYIPDGSYSLAITSGVIGAIVAAIAALLANYLYLKHINSKNKTSHFSEASMFLLNSFEDAASSYWVKDRKEDNDEEMKLLEIKIKHGFYVLNKCLQEFIKTLSKNEDDKIKIEKNINIIFDLATGGDFESDNKKSDMRMALMISKHSSNIKAILLKYSQRTT